MISHSNNSFSLDKMLYEMKAIAATEQDLNKQKSLQLAYFNRNITQLDLAELEFLKQYMQGINTKTVEDQEDYFKIVRTEQNLALVHPGQTNTWNEMVTVVNNAITQKQQAEQKKMMTDNITAPVKEMLTQLLTITLENSNGLLKKAKQRQEEIFNQVIKHYTLPQLNFLLKHMETVAKGEEKNHSFHLIRTARNWSLNGGNTTTWKRMFRQVNTQIKIISADISTVEKLLQAMKEIKEDKDLLQNKQAQEQFFNNAIESLNLEQVKQLLILMIDIQNGKQPDQFFNLVRTERFSLFSHTGNTNTWQRMLHTAKHTLMLKLGAKENKQIELDQAEHCAVKSLLDQHSGRWYARFGSTRSASFFASHFKTAQNDKPARDNTLKLKTKTANGSR